MVLNTETKQQLEQLLAKPGSATQDDIPFLQQLIKTFPYYQPLHLLLAKASSDSENKQAAFTKAALYTNGGILHRIIHEPQQLAVVEDINVISYQPWTNIHFDIAKDEPKAEVVESVSEQEVENIPDVENLAPLADNQITDVEASKEEVDIPKDEEVKTPIIADAPEIENLAPLANEIIAVEASEELEVLREEEVEAIPYSAPTIADAPEIENLAPLANEVIKVCEPEISIDEVETTNVTSEADEQETFEEIAEFVAPPEEVSLKDAEPFIETEEQEVPIEVRKVEEIDVETEEDTIKEKISEEDKEEELEIESVASFDFFEFDRNFSSEKITDEEPETIVEKIVEEPTIHSKTSQENIVSKYDDDQLPFTFLWWLAKTRKDHEQIFRPFASPVKANAQPLQQQYVEHIFHIQAPLDLGEEEQATVSVPATKGNEIIENFIKNDPQIKALKPDQINNENKAKRSAEDSNDVVSETLAQIYIEQMLYHKAIDTYQKLSLKFPEKSGYFADLIQSLEKKI